MDRKGMLLPLQMIEMALASQVVVAARLSRFMVAPWPLPAADQKEWVRMGAEKVEAFAESSVAMARAGARLQRDVMALWGATSCAASARAAGSSLEAGNRLMGAALRPYHRRSRANARRLGR